MKILQKIAMIVMVGVVAGNADVWPCAGRWIKEEILFPWNNGIEKDYVFDIKTPSMHLVLPTKIYFYQQSSNIMFVKASIFCDKIIVYDCISGEDIIYPYCIHTKVVNGFVGKILKAFKLMHSNYVGKTLLNDICTASSTPLIIFPHDFLLKNPKVRELTTLKPVNLITDLKTQEIRQTSNLSEVFDVIERFYKNDGIDQLVQLNFPFAKEALNGFFEEKGNEFFPPDVFLNIFGNDGFEKGRLVEFIRFLPVSQFVPTSKLGVLENVVYLRLPESIDNHKQWGFSINRKQIHTKKLREIIQRGFYSSNYQISNSNLRGNFSSFFKSFISLEVPFTLQCICPFEADICLFHELNHCRHFLLGFPTIKVQGSPNINKFDNRSSLLISITQCNMVRPEEELQLTGITTLQSLDGYIIDPINETNYRITSGKNFIRFPYDILNKNSPTQLLVNDAELLLKVATLTKVPQ